MTEVTSGGDCWIVLYRGIPELRDIQPTSQSPWRTWELLQDDQEWMGFCQEHPQEIQTTPRSASEQECGEESRHTGCSMTVCKAVHKGRAQNLGSESSSTKLKEDYLWFPLSQKPLSEGTQ